MLGKNAQCIFLKTFCNILCNVKRVFSYSHYVNILTNFYNYFPDNITL